MSDWLKRMAKVGQMRESGQLTSEEGKKKLERERQKRPFSSDSWDWTTEKEPLVDLATESEPFYLTLQE